MDLQLIKERKAAVVDEMRSLTNTAMAEERDLDTKENTQFETLKDKLKGFESQISRAEVLAEAERSMAASPGSPRGMGDTFERACRNFQITKAIAARLEPGSVDAGREHEVSQELARRSGRSPQGILVPHEIFIERRDVLTSGSGAHLVPEQHRADLFIDRLRASLQVQALGATVLSGLVGNQDIPRLTGSATGYWVAEHNAITESDHTFDTVELGPKTVGAEVEYSRRMLINAVPSVENLVRSDLAYVLAAAIDNAAINADGTGNKPTGVLSSGIGSVSFGGAPTWAKVHDIVATVASSNALKGNMGWLTNPWSVKKLSTEPQTTDGENFIMSSPDMLVGYRLEQSTAVPGDPTSSPVVDGTLIFGNWADLLIGYWSGVDILVNPYHSDVYSKGGVKINALQDCDIAVRHAESFCAATDMEL